MPTDARIWEVTIFSRCTGSNFKTVLHYEGGDANATSESLANEWAANDYQIWIAPTDFKLQVVAIKAQQINPQIGIPFVVQPGQRNFSAASGKTVNTLTMLVSFRTVNPARTGRGRLYWPAVFQGDYDDGGSVNQRGFDGYNGAMAGMMARHNAPDNPPSKFLWIVWSRKNTEPYRIIGWVVSPYLAQLRRRKIGVGY